MYGQGNYAPPFGQGPHAPTPSFQQRPPIHPPPPFQQGPPASQPSAIQQGPPSNGVQPAPPSYQNAPLAPLQQGPSVQGLPSAMLNAGQSYLPPPPPLPSQVHGSTSMAHSYPVSHQNAAWTHNLHHLPPVTPVGRPPGGPSHPEMFRAPPPHRVPQPFPSQGQTMYRGQVPQPQPVGVQGTQHIPPPPLPPTSSFFSQASYGTFVRSAHQDSHMPASSAPPPPPPPPSSPPPPPPSPPPPTSPLPCSWTLSSAPSLITSNEPPRSEFRPSSSEHFGLELEVSNSFSKLLDSHQTRDLPTCEEKSVSPPRMQPDSLMDAGVSHSPSYSDMDVEDDNTHLDKERQDDDSVKGLNLKSVSTPTELDMKAQLHAVPAADNASEHIASKDAIADNSPGGSRRLAEGIGSTLFHNQDDSTSGHSLSKVDTTVTILAGASECNLNDNVNSSFITSQSDFGRSSASVAASDIGSGKYPGQLIEGTSPFRLLQDYASDDSAENDDEPHLQDVSPVTASPLNTDVGTSLREDIISNVQTEKGSKSLSTSEVGFGTFSGSDVARSPCIPLKALESTLELQRTSKETDVRSNATGRSEGRDNYRNQESTVNAASHEAFQEKDGFGCVDAASKSGKYRKEDMKRTPPPLKVDEFGRLVREGGSDTDSDDSRRKGKRVKSGRSRSRSRSPHDGRRRKGSWRRQEKRSRSRSWSPKKRRSRSRSPTLRRGGDLGGDRTRRDKAQIPECFDFLRGRCYRGASCRYMHSSSNKSDGSRHYRSKHQHVEVPPSSRSFDLHEEMEKIPFKRSLHEQDAVESQETQPFQKMPEESFGVTKDGGSHGKENAISINDAVQLVIADRESISLVDDVAESQRSAALEKKTRVNKEELVERTNLLDNDECPKGPEMLHQIDIITDCSVADVNAPKPHGDISHGIPSTESLAVPQSQANLSAQVFQNVDRQPQQMGDTSVSDMLPIQTSGSFLNQLPISGPHPDKSFSIQSFPGMGSTNQSYSHEISSQSWPPKEITPPILSTAGFPHYPSQLPPLPSLSQGSNIPPAPQLSGDYNLMPPSAKFQSHSASVENFPPYQGPLSNQHSHFSVVSNASWTSLPPPPPRPPYVNEVTQNATTGMPNVASLNFQPNLLPPRNDFSSQTAMRPYPAEVPAYSHVVDYPHRIHSPRQEPNRPPFHVDNFRPTTLSVGNPTSQPFGGLNLVGEDRFSRLPVQGLGSSSSTTQGNIATQHISSIREPAGRQMQSFPVDNMRPGELFLSPSDNPYLQQQQPFCSRERPAADSVSVHSDEPGKSDSAMSRHASDILDRSHPSHLSNFGGSRISNYFNPYASTFDQPLNSKFSSNNFNSEKDTLHSFKHDTPFSLSHVPVDGQKGTGSVSSRHTISSPNSVRAADHVLPRLGGEQYDPLFDSIEPSSNSFRKFDHGIKPETTNDSDSMLRLSGRYKPLDVEENNKQKEAGVVAVTTSVENDNDEFGETADAEVGAVENGSPSTPLDVMDTAAGEIEIDQIKTPGKSKKNKDSRSMKLFKGALADFVKEVLKPSWRQGNMSKEAFKTIVKKTVDKVAGAMKNHQIPKSQSKINHYIDSSQRKLTKLVMGYVDKYVKV